MPDAPANLQVAEQIVQILCQFKLPVVVIGAVALAAHRYPRFTEDIDLGVLASPAEMQSLTDFLRAEGFDTDFHTTRQNLRSLNKWRLGV